MTDTTDIKALLAKRILHYADMAELTSEKSSVFGADLIRLTGETITNLLDQLEAERQRADSAHKYGSERDSENESLMLTVGRLRVEIAALKGEQVPYAFSYNYAGCETSEGFQDWRKELSREKPPEWMLETGKVTDLVELFTAPQNPVVLPKSHYVCGCADRFMSAPEVIAAIEDAGGIVKDGE